MRLRFAVEELRGIVAEADAEGPAPEGMAPVVYVVLDTIPYDHTIDVSIRDLVVEVEKK